MATVAWGSGLSDPGTGSLAVSFLGADLSGAGAMLAAAAVPAGFGDENGATVDVEGGLMPTGGGLPGGFGREGPLDRDVGMPTGDDCGGGTPGGFGGAGWVGGGLGKLPPGGGMPGGFGAGGTDAGLAGKFNMAVSRGLAAIGIG